MTGSATKQSSFLAAAKQAGLLRFARNDGTCIFVLTARFRLSFAYSLSLSEERAQGKPGADCARRSRAREHTGIPCAKHMGNDYRYSRDIPAFPAQWLYDLLRALPGERRFLSPLSAGYPPAK